MAEVESVIYMLQCDGMQPRIFTSLDVAKALLEGLLMHRHCVEMFTLHKYVLSDACEYVSTEEVDLYDLMDEDRPESEDVSLIDTDSDESD